MSGFGTSYSRPIYGRGPSPGLRFFLYALLSLGLLYVDQRAGWSDRLRYWLQAAAYPMQVAIHSPAAAWHPAARTDTVDRPSRRRTTCPTVRHC